VVLFGNTEPIVSPPVWSAILAYTGLHVAVFLLFAMLVTWLVVRADRQMLVLFALFMLFVAFEAFFSGLLTLLLQGTEGHFPVWKVLGANSPAAVAMGGYLLSRHPALRRRLHRQPLGA
jgi:FtsH-binding integral membrane protein